MELRTDRVGLLLDQLDSTIDVSRNRLRDMSDDEFLWEPAPGAWSIRRRGAARTSSAYGRGDWVLDMERGDPESSPVTTIAWRLSHLLSGVEGRYEWTFGARAVDPDVVVEFCPSADTTLANLWSAVERWSAAIDATSEDDLDTVGFGQYPHGLDPDLPFIAIVWWTNRELIHHLAEAALLRDLWATKGTAT